MKHVIFDIDNCIADDERRRVHLPDLNAARAFPLQASDWDAYHEDAENDPVLNRQFVNSYLTAIEDYHLLFITARPDIYREKTIWWLREHFPLLAYKPYTILLRPAGNTQPSPDLKVALFEEYMDFCGNSWGWPDVYAAHDDRADVLIAYGAQGVENLIVLNNQGAMSLGDALFMNITPSSQRTTEELLGAAAIDIKQMNNTTPDILEGMAKTFRERSKVYGPNYLMVGEVMKVMFPDGLPDPKMVHRPEWHLFELLIVKLTRFAVSELKHVDSVHDTAVYAAMIEQLLLEEEFSA